MLSTVRLTWCMMDTAEGAGRESKREAWVRHHTGRTTSGWTQAGALLLSGAAEFTPSSGGAAQGAGHPGCCCV